MKTKICSKCKKELPLTTEYYHRRRDRKIGFRSECKECGLKQKRDYRKTEGSKIMRKKYQQSNRGKESQKKANEKYLSSEKNREKARQCTLRWRHSKNGRKSDIRTQTERQRNLKWIELLSNPFDELEEIEWHHITDKYVVAIPKDLHVLYNGYKNHREMCLDIIKQIYISDVDKLMRTINE